jgi:hypothetical protein
MPILKQRLFQRNVNVQWFVFFFYLTIAIGLYFWAIPYFKMQVVTNSEAYTFTNVPIDFALYGKFHYPLVSNVFYFSDINSFIIGAPLYYLVSGFLLKVIGIGVWQVMLPAFLTILSIVFSVTFIARKFYGYLTAILAIILSATWEYIPVIWGFGRPDPLLGLIYGFVIILLYFAWLQSVPDSMYKWLSFLLGALVILMIAAHWQGVFGLLFLPVHLLVMRGRGKSWLLHMALLTLGGGIIFVPWAIFYAYYGDNIFYVFFSIYLQGLRRFTVFKSDFAPSPLIIFYPIYQMKGGWAIGAGGLLFLAYYFIYFINPLRRRLVNLYDLKDRKFFKMDMLLLSSTVFWFLFYFSLVANHHYQYLSNILIPLLLISSRGYVLFGASFRTLLARKSVIYNFALVGVILFSGNYLRQTLDLKNPFPILPLNQVHSAARRSFDKFVGRGDQIAIGSAAYLYLYDRQYTSNFLLESKAALTQSIAKITWSAPALSYTERGELLKNAGQVVVIPDEFGMYQAKYFDERIWSPNFEKIAAVFIPGAPSPFPVLYRNDIADDFFQKRGLEINTSGCDDGVLWIVYDPATAVGSGIANHEWISLSEVEKQSYILNYFESRNWFGQGPINDPKELTRWIAVTDAYYKAQVGYQEYIPGSKRSFEQAMDHLINLELRNIWCGS